MDKKEIIDFFDAASYNWDKIQVRNDKIISYILDKGEITKGKRVLDIACGTGVLFPDYIKRGAMVTGIDISPEMVKLAKSKFPQIKVICEDAENYRFEKVYDCIMIYNAFPHFSNPVKLFSNLYQALKSGGRLTVAHGISEKELALCHEKSAKTVSLPLPSKQELSDMLSPYFCVDVMASDEEKYIVSGIKK